MNGWDSARGGDGPDEAPRAGVESRVPVVRILIEVGAEFDAKSQGGFTASLFVGRQDVSELARALVNASADVNQTVVEPPAEAEWGAESWGMPTGGPSALNLALANAHDERAAILLEIGVGVHRGMNLRSSPKTASEIQRLVEAAEVSTEVEPEQVISGARL